MNKALKLIIAISLLLAGIIGLGMTLCGALSTVAALHDKAFMLLLLSVPSALVGGMLLYFAIQLLRRLYFQGNT